MEIQSENLKKLQGEIQLIFEQQDKLFTQQDQLFATQSECIDMMKKMETLSGKMDSIGENQQKIIDDQQKTFENTNQKMKTALEFMSLNYVDLADKNEKRDERIEDLEKAFETSKSQVEELKNVLRRVKEKSEKPSSDEIDGGLVGPPAGCATGPPTQAPMGPGPPNSVGSVPASPHLSTNAEENNEVKSALCCQHSLNNICNELNLRQQKQQNLVLFGLQESNNAL